MNGRVLTVGLLGFCLLLGALITRSGDMALMALPFLTYLCTAVWGAPVLERIHLRAERSVAVEPGGEGPGVEVRVVVKNAGMEIGPVRIFDLPQPAMKLTSGSLQSWAVIPAGETAELSYTFQAERGSFGWKSVQVVASDPLGLFETWLELPAPDTLQLSPRFQKLRAIPLRPDSTLHVPGSIPAGLGGSGTDFWGIREYHPGDSLRRLDWRMTARHPQRFFTREFEQEEIADIGLILDARQGVDLRIGEDSLFEHTLRATASLAELFLRQGHRVSLFTFGDQMSMIYPGFSKVQLNRILRSLANIRPGKNAARLSLEYIPLQSFSSRALLVLLSPLTPSDWSIFPRIRAHGNQGLLISPDPIDFARAVFAQDTPTQLAVRAARLERRLKLRKISQLHIRVVDWQVSQPLTPLVRNALRHQIVRSSQD